MSAQPYEPITPTPTAREEIHRACHTPKETARLVALYLVCQRKGCDHGLSLTICKKVITDDIPVEHRRSRLACRNEVIKMHQAAAARPKRARDYRDELTPVDMVVQLLERAAKRAAPPPDNNVKRALFVLSAEDLCNLEGREAFHDAFDPSSLEIDLSTTTIDETEHALAAMHRLRRIARARAVFSQVYREPENISDDMYHDLDYFSIQLDPVYRSYVFDDITEYCVTADSRLVFLIAQVFVNPHIDLWRQTEFLRTRGVIHDVDVVVGWLELKQDECE